MKLHHITIEQLSSISPSRILNYKGKLMVSDHVAHEYLFEEPCRIDAVLILVCIRGELEYEVNLEHNVVTSSSILVSMPENIVQFCNSRNLDAYAILVSSELIKSLPYDMLQKANSYLPIKHYFHASVPIEQMAPLVPFYQLIRHFLSNIVPETDQIVGGLLQSFLMSIFTIMREHQLRVLDIDRTATHGSRQLFEHFMELLVRHHQQERSVQFYADHLCITPKYLSTAVRQFTGKSPSDWICEYVIAEAKSLLHYSQMSVQEVAFRLNFPTQSSFGKYFKQKTGLSPLQYVKSLRLMA